MLFALQFVEKALALGLRGLAGGVLELAEQVFLLFGELRRRFDDDGDKLVAARLIANIRNALAAQTEDGTGLRALGDGVAHLAVERRHLDRRAKRRLREGDRHLAMDVRAVAREDRMVADMDGDEQIAPCPCPCRSGTGR